MHPKGSRREVIKVGIALVVATLTFAYFIFVLSNPVTEWLLETVGLTD